MEKSLLFFRHAKSDWGASYHHDHDRPLNLRGKRAACAMGRWLAHTGPIPDLILCSTAVRAQSTCVLAKESGVWAAEVQYERGLYHATPSDLLHYINELTSDVKVAMLVGHQPTWAATTAVLTGNAVTKFPTASIARINIKVDEWRHCAAGMGSVVWHQYPKRLPDMYYDTN